MLAELLIIIIAIVKLAIILVPVEINFAVVIVTFLRSLKKYDIISPFFILFKAFTFVLRSFVNSLSLRSLSIYTFSLKSKFFHNTLVIKTPIETLNN